MSSKYPPSWHTSNWDINTNFSRYKNQWNRRELQIYLFFSVWASKKFLRIFWKLGECSYWGSYKSVLRVHFLILFLKEPMTILSKKYHTISLFVCQIGAQNCNSMSIWPLKLFIWSYKWSFDGYIKTDWSIISSFRTYIM